MGSDLDVVIVVEDSREPFLRRASKWDVTGFPVPVDLLVYTEEEWEKVKGRLGEVRWIYRYKSR